ncbi:hypothetical protein CYMTET_5347 [Cymbomonas tetramitiformis]|uniref:Glycosyltransferase 2-like domain-containing protein n=1 Tax=Cymbomonas tetramitiformis TaxID=36881 RepID=A0AAE0LJ56_9CHLO|nr:hypothetical protein CYMTET_5347 [Cymbomonas tetramitiformis]
MVQNRKARSSKKRQIGESSTLVVVPGCYDEADRLPKQEFLDYASALEDIVFLFVNDGSKDGTLALLNSAQSSHPEKVQVLDLPLNRGKAEAVRLGMQRSCEIQARYVAFWDADLATPLETIKEFRT